MSNRNKEQMEVVDQLDDDGNDVEFSRATLNICSDSEPQMEKDLKSSGDKNENHVTEPPRVMGGATNGHLKPESTMNFFALRNGAFESAVENSRPTILPHLDGELRGSWLLTEIDHWDNEKERLILLTDHTLLIIKYDFIVLQIVEYQRYPLLQFDKIIAGDLTYPDNSLVPNRTGKGVRVLWNKGNAVHFSKMWNPWSKTIPWLTFTSHPLYNSSEMTRDYYDIENFMNCFIQAVEMENEVRIDGESCEIEMKPIVIENYVGLASFIHNANGLGFFKSRGKISF